MELVTQHTFDNNRKAVLWESYPHAIPFIVDFSEGHIITYDDLNGIGSIVNSLEIASEIQNLITAESMTTEWTSDLAEQHLERQQAVLNQCQALHETRDIPAFVAQLNEQELTFIDQYTNIRSDL